jgi:hypothetical protein
MSHPGTHEPDPAQAVRRNARPVAIDAGPEATLRMLALAPPPVGLEERIEARLRAEMRAGFRLEVPKARVLAWPSIQRAGRSWRGSAAGRTAAAAAIVAAVVGSGWSIASRVQPAISARGVVAPVRAVGPGGFSSAGAMRTPQTFNGPVIAPVAQAQQSNSNAVKSATTRKAKSGMPPAQKDGLTGNQAGGQAK